jgi:hypothetical protein
MVFRFFKFHALGARPYEEDKSLQALHMGPLKITAWIGFWEKRLVDWPLPDALSLMRVLK